MSRFSVKWKKHTLKFRFRAGTSRGYLEKKDTWYLILHDLEEEITGIGEAGPLKEFSLDNWDDFEEQISIWSRNVENHLNLYGEKHHLPDIPFQLPALKMGLETAWLDLKNGGIRMIFDNDFFIGNNPIPINGLIWMGDRNFMLQQAEEKLEKGFKCLKMKIGSIDFKTELDILQHIRNHYPADQVVLRVDANGAFRPDEALEKLEKLHVLGIHSVEQPIKKGNKKRMNELCLKSPVPIALDEELVGIHGLEEKENLLNEIQPQYIVLKPTLLGGFSETREWIELAEASGIGWWITSALESNIGLNAISQFTAEFENELHQGLGTGQLYHNNINGPLVIEAGMIHYRPDFEWDLKLFGP